MGALDAFIGTAISINVPFGRCGPLPRSFLLRDGACGLMFRLGLGRGQVVRHRFLVSAFAGSNPAAPAIFRKSAALLNVQDGTCRCAQHVEGDAAAEEAP